ncbi:hypothetical protein MMC25_002837 [Agyrium rufum]|nr:hypothetical protein [Agyrium rufum]
MAKDEFDADHFQQLDKREPTGADPRLSPLVYVPVAIIVKAYENADDIEGASALEKRYAPLKLSTDAAAEIFKRSDGPDWVKGITERVRTPFLSI